MQTSEWRKKGRYKSIPHNEFHIEILIFVNIYSIFYDAYECKQLYLHGYFT